MAGRLTAAGAEFELRGRADGVRTRSDGSLEVEELKSVLGGEPAVALRRYAHLQVALYAWLLARAGHRVARATVRWLRPGPSGAVDETGETVALDFPALESRVRASLADLLAERRRGEQRRALRRAIGSLAFPHPRPREGQDRIRAAAARALAQGEHLLVEAPTGVGKTAAVLQPALEDALLHDRRLFVLTARNLQQQASLATLERLLPPGVGPVAQLHARRALCASPATRCDPEECAFARGYGERSAASGLLDAAGVVPVTDVRAWGGAHGLCPDALARDLSGLAVATVCDSNFALDPGVRLPGFAPGGRLDDVVLVIDEAHQLAERTRQNLSVRLDARQVALAREQAGLGGGAVHLALEAVLGELERALPEIALDAVGELPETTDFSVPVELPGAVLESLGEALDAALIPYLDYLGRFGGPLEAGPVGDVRAALRRLARAVDEADPGMVFLVSRRDGALALEALCLDPRRHLASVFDRCHAVIGMSATLTPSAYHADLLGLDPARLATLAVGSPFPAGNRPLVIDPGVDTRFRQRSREAPRIAARLAAFADAVPGNCLVLFPSFAFLEQVAAGLAAPGRRVLRQRAGDDDEARRGVLAALREGGDEPILLLAVAGGVFAEGIDLPGDALRAVAVVGPCLPPRDTERELLAALCEERYGAGFDCAYAIPGITRVIQGAGRLIRSPEDRGVVALLGRRFLAAPFDALLGAGGFGDGAVVGDPAAVAAAFFARSPEGPAPGALRQDPPEGLAGP